MNANKIFSKEIIEELKIMGFKQIERNRLAMIVRRYDYLVSKIDGGRQVRNGISYIMQEISAIEWIMEKATNGILNLAENRR